MHITVKAEVGVYEDVTELFLCPRGLKVAKFVALFFFL